MEIRPRLADIVIVASAHNPSIMSPEWLKENSLITEEPKHFVHTPDFSVFESDSFSLVVDRQRLQITAKKQDKISLNSLAKAAVGYIKLLHHIPYISMGLNFVWSCVVGEDEKLPKIGLSVNANDIKPLFKAYEVSYGGIIYAKKEPYRLKLVIEQQGNNSFVQNFNYHYELTGMAAEDIAGLIGDFLSRYEDSAAIVKELCLIGRP